MVEIQRLAAQAVGEVRAGRSLGEVLPALVTRQPRLTARERAAIQDLAYGTLRFLARLEAILGALLDNPLSDAAIRHLLLVALYQLAYGKSAHYAVVDHAVAGCARVRRAAAKGLVNAVLRNFLRRRETLLARVDRDEAARYSYPRWWIDKLKREYPETFRAILEAGNTHPPLTLRVNRRAIAREGYRALLAARGIGASVSGESALTLATPLPIERIPGFSEGLVSVQDAAAQLAAPLLEVRDGMRVLDACAAPGGKTAHILELAAVELTALDSDATRLERVRANLARLKLDARIGCGDARGCDWWDGRPYDRILADVPCSASGVVRRHPDIKWLRRESDIAQFAATQRAMLEALWQLLVGGGKLLYATCSVFGEENRQQVAQFVERHRDARLLDLSGFEAHKERPTGQLLPDEQHDGFFYALLQKR
ncbi:MAG: 16S rRNA (cytosine(967)-C(5))-methyltransferase RsmB [Betaproteobacteria bacterium]|nr:16S rRNA (cytosine(967)-C(5))-methyltransferase RsmB [Betaproteobacteria bacterium]